MAVAADDAQPIPADKKKDLVILVPGIRDHALWGSELRSVLEAEGFIVELTNFGRFGLPEFLMPIDFFRRQAQAELARQIGTAWATHQYPTIHIIAHSFGTYLITKLLEETYLGRDAADEKPRFTFDRVVFCGSVVSYKFPFQRHHKAGQFLQPILSEVGTRDQWPALAKFLTWWYGAGGTYGFRRPLVRDRWHNGGKHNFFLNADFCRQYWLPFLQTGEIVEASGKPEKPAYWLAILDSFRLYPLALLLSAVMILMATFDVWPWVANASPAQDSLATLVCIGDAASCPIETDRVAPCGSEIGQLAVSMCPNSARRDTDFVEFKVTNTTPYQCVPQVWRVICH